MNKIKWQGTYFKRACHAFLTKTEAGGTSLCGLAGLTTGETSSEPKIRPCGSCIKKIAKLNITNKE